MLFLCYRMGSTSLRNPSHRLQILPERMLLHRVSMDCSFLQGTSTVHMVTFMAFRVGICSGVALSRGCMHWYNLSRRGFLHGLQAPGAPPPLLLHWPCVCRVFPLTFFSPLSYAAPAQYFFPFLEYVILETPPKLMIGSMLASGISVLEPPGDVFLTHRGSSWSLSTTTTFAALLLQ